MSAIKKSISMPQRLYEFAIKRAHDCFGSDSKDRGLSRYLQALIMVDMKTPLLEPIPEHEQKPKLPANLLRRVKN